MDVRWLTVEERTPQRAACLSFLPDAVRQTVGCFWPVDDRIETMEPNSNGSRITMTVPAVIR